VPSVAAKVTPNGSGSSTGASGAQSPRGPSGVLPFTGAPLLGLLEVSVAALMVGAGLYMLGGKRRRRV
jgi:hypothetical protein